MRPLLTNASLISATTVFAFSRRRFGWRPTASGPKMGSRDCSMKLNIADLRSLSLSRQAGDCIRLKFPPPEKLLTRLAAAGAWWTLPLALLGKDKLLAVAATPQSELHESGIVIVDDFEMTTIATNLAHLVPAVLLRVNLVSEAWDRTGESSGRGLEGACGNSSAARREG